MKTERRALTSQEIKQLPDEHGDDGHWKELLGLSVFMGMVCGGVIGVVSQLLADYAGLDITGYIGMSNFVVGASVAMIVGIGNFVSLLRDYLNARKSYELFKARTLTSDDLLVESCEVKDCKLVRDPEHGQPMFFVCCDDGTILCIVAGEEELYEDWDEHPLRLEENTRALANLKVIRDPKTKELILHQFSGPVIDFDACYIINVSPDKWPIDAKAIRCRWEDVEKRFKLVKMEQGEA